MFELIVFLIKTLIILYVAILLALASLYLPVLKPFRQRVVSARLFRFYKKILPSMSNTERTAIEAGTVWWEGTLFSGKPNWKYWFGLSAPRLTTEEKHFIEHEVNHVCQLANDWQITTTDHDLSAECWQYLKDKGFFGMIIPKRYGGLAFSSYAHSEVITKLATRSSTLAVIVMVPNSLGPAELLLQYGTDTQKDYYLPRLAQGKEIPAFALTSPWAGSDASAIPDYAIVCQGQWQGKDVLGMKVTWKKRYITLAPVCTILGLAFRLFDPDQLLGGKVEVGITCALVPHDHPGMQIGRRHQPLNAAFMNGPTEGHDVFMPLAFIIGGAAMAGQGWRMLMECLSVGRSISLPASNTGAAKLTARAVGGYARVRSQFNLPVGRFEGVAEALAHIGGLTYTADATRTMTAAAVDLGEKPSVLSAIAKYHVTEATRVVVNKGMDVLGGKGICLGPSNFLARAYQQIPISITVEGANIMTRSLIIFGQGAIRCHPYVLTEMLAAENKDEQAGLADFDQAIFKHLLYTAHNKLRTFAHALTLGYFSRTDDSTSPLTRRYQQRLNAYSAALAFLSDTAMMMMGGQLKSRELISARLGDMLSQLYLLSCVMKKFESEGAYKEDEALYRWSMEYGLHALQEAAHAFLQNFPFRWVAIPLRWMLFPYGRHQKRPSDQLTQAVAQSLTENSTTRTRLTRGCFIETENTHDTVNAIEKALQCTIDAEPVASKIRQAEKQGVFAQSDTPHLANLRDIASLAHRLKIIDDTEYDLIRTSYAWRDQIIAVDDFPFDLTETTASSSPKAKKNQ